MIKVTYFTKFAQNPYLPTEKCGVQLLYRVIFFISIPYCKGKGERILHCPFL